MRITYDGLQIAGLIFNFFGALFLAITLFHNDKAVKEASASYWADDDGVVPRRFEALKNDRACMRWGAFLLVLGFSCQLVAALCQKQLPWCLW
jgi:hypothetical protein